MSNGISSSGAPEAPKASEAKLKLRAALLDQKNSVPQRKALKLFDMDVELLQPSLRDIMKARAKTAEQAQVSIIVNYVVVPGTNERIFDDNDTNHLLNWAFGPDIARLAEAVNELTGLNVEDAKEDLRTDPLGGGSSSSAGS